MTTRPQSQADPSRTARLSDAREALGAGDTDAARSALETVLARHPDDTEAVALLSQTAFEEGLSDESLALLSRALGLAPGSGMLWFTAAQRYGRLGHTGDALAAFERAAELRPKDLRPRVERARMLQTLGRFEEAETAFRKLLKSHPENTELYRIFLATKRLGKGDPLIRRMAALWKHPRLNDAGRMNLGFALAKAFEETGDSARVFPMLRAANEAQARLAPYDRAAREAEWSGMLAAQDGADYTPEGPEMALRPVFVTGMPRSGTTLVEQIIARHSAVAAGEELGHALKLAIRRFGQGADMAPLSGIAPEALAGWSAAYQRLAARDCGMSAGVVTDKSIQSHMIFGLIHRGMPGARIVIVHRDPRDIALSIFKNPFTLGTHRYANRLEDIADEIGRFRASVSFWRERLPEGAMLEMRYEDLVSDPEPNARALIARSGLGWEDACLDSSATSGAVRTLSLAQVRQPIHAGRKEAWRRYEAELQPFVAAWGERPWD